MLVHFGSLGQVWFILVNWVLAIFANFTNSAKLVNWVLAIFASFANSTNLVNWVLAIFANVANSANLVNWFSLFSLIILTIY